MTSEALAFFLGMATGTLMWFVAGVLAAFRLNRDTPKPEPRIAARHPDIICLSDVRRGIHREPQSGRGA